MADSNMRDFATNEAHAASSTIPIPDADVEAQSHSRSNRGRHSISHLIHPRDDQHAEPRSSIGTGVRRTNTVTTRTSIKSLRRRGRAETAVAYGAEEMGRATGWAPGLEPGVNANDPPPYEETDNEEPQMDVRHLEQLHQQCEIMVVDYSPDKMKSQFLDNENLEDYLSQPQEDWAQVRWINVNGLSWDVIRALAKYKNLHPLAVEDLMNTRNRTKADWYHDHTYIVLPLQKLVNVQGEMSSDDEEEDAVTNADDYDEYVNGDPNKMKTNAKVGREKRRRRHAMLHRKSHKGAIRRLIGDIFSRKKPLHRSNLTKTDSFQHSNSGAPWAPRNVRLLHQWHAGPNLDRLDYMQRHSTMGSRGLGVSIEQVSIFLTADNTIISFFEYSAQDVEVPIMRRLASKSTILRSSADASLLMQSLLDTIVDLAIPVTTAYQDAIGDLELDVLTDPNIEESTKLYILTSELATLRSAIFPVNQLIGSLREHKSSATAITFPSRAATPMQLNRQLGDSEVPQARTMRSEIVPAGVTISDLTKTYLSDVEDHAQMITDLYDLLRRNADNLVDLIFNTVSAYQNEAMKQLTIVTAFFLPLTFLTGYFGMNFDAFAAVHDNSDSYFWQIAVPVCVVVAILLLRDFLWRWVQKRANISLIKRGRKKRLSRTK